MKDSVETIKKTVAEVQGKKNIRTGMTETVEVTVKPDGTPVSFAHGLNFYKMFWILFIGSFAGVVIETIYCFVTSFELVNRQGLIYGPFNLVYGIGALVITVCLYRLAEKNNWWLFFGGALIGSTFEYMCSWFQETMFGTVSWQYDYTPLNINGRIDLMHSVFWGVLALFWMRLAYPRLSNLIEKIPNKIGIIVTWILVVFMIFNTIISGLAVWRMSCRHNDIPASNSIEEFLDEQYPDDLLQKIYPSMVFV